ncbi:DNA adenine methylase [Microbacterium sp. BF1]|uniref:DNA adenine methylase n=1 Tax=Microbacterium sp. BF1 TaxID=2821146 RepID=UPI000D850167|nr:DNA adenine methylase [Microbacterium sp. BF1]
MVSKNGSLVLNVQITRPQYDSPLRYPGGKSSLSAFLARAIELSGTQRPTYVEPFAGGAGAAVTLLLQDRVESVVINDLDPAVHAFWRSATDNGAAFAKKVEEVPLDLAEWRRQKGIYALGQTSSVDSFDLGFAFFYLNRTNRSGVLNAGVIGGQKQDGRYLIDARFNRERLANRIRSIGRLKDRITVTADDGRTVIEKYAQLPNSFLYVDPPYVQMGGSLYLNAFSEADHAFLATCLNRNATSNWILTYDDVSLIQELYEARYQERFELIYSARNAGRATELMIVSDAIRDAFLSCNSKLLGN